MVVAALGGLFLFGRAAIATPPTVAPSTETEQNQPASNTPAPATNFFTGLGRSQYLLGEMGGIRPFLSRFGITLSILETSEVLGNVTGGTRRGAGCGRR